MQQYIALPLKFTKYPNTTLHLSPVTKSVLNRTQSLPKTALACSQKPNQALKCSEKTLHSPALLFNCQQCFVLLYSSLHFFD